jgi:heparosan-N-sulfate-glucuronate 5-epimerase
MKAAGAGPERRFHYLRRVACVYLFPQRGPLAFWYETPELNDRAFDDGIGQYPMTFAGKAAYRGPFDAGGVPLLDYRGSIGRQYNPIAIAQYGLGSYNRWRGGRDELARGRFLRVADWLTDNLERNPHGIAVWPHRFDWPYRQRLVAPWYSGLAQGQGVSVLVRAAFETGRSAYATAAHDAFAAFQAGPAAGGVVARDETGAPWIEEYLVDPPSHILNGFIWGLWGVHDYARWSASPAARSLLEGCIETLARNLPRYDTGSWSLYEINDETPMLASPYYHRLHIVQLRVLHRMTGHEVFARHADRWQRYAESPRRRWSALARKAWFKLRRY